MIIQNSDTINISWLKTPVLLKYALLAKAYLSS